MLTFSLIRITNYEQLIDHRETALKEKEREREAIYRHGSFLLSKKSVATNDSHWLQYFIFLRKMSNLH